jgi:glutathione gamma-glutamylcysteinyltransferase
MFINVRLRKMKQIISLYKRRLHHPLIPFSSNLGKKLFRESLEQGNMESYFELAEQYVTQARPQDCGVSSLVMVLNTLAIDPGKVWKEPWRWFTEEILDCSDRKSQGLLLQEFMQVALCNRLWVMGFHPSKQKYMGKAQEIETTCKIHNINKIDMKYATVDTFRNAIISTSRRHGLHLVVNCSRAALKQTGIGHYSPVSGYHEGSDMCLVLDVARFKYPAYWCPVPLLYKSLEDIDPDSGKCRGFVLMSRSRFRYSQTCTVALDKNSLHRIPPIQQSLQILNNFPSELLPVVSFLLFEVQEFLSANITRQKFIDEIEKHPYFTKNLQIDPKLHILIEDFVGPDSKHAACLLAMSITDYEISDYLSPYTDRIKEQLGMLRFKRDSLL